jgi:hypothetical protein
MYKIIYDLYCHGLHNKKADELTSSASLEGSQSMYRTDIIAAFNQWGREKDLITSFLISLFRL